MNKLPIIRFLAFCASLSFLACSDDSSPTREESCAKGVSVECLVGKWNFEGVYETDSNKSNDCPESGSLELEANGGFCFKGGVNNIDDCGSWELDGNAITISYLNYDQTKGTVSIASEGARMNVTGTGSRSAFALCNTHKIEKFVYRN